MARLVVSVAAGVIAGVVTENPLIGLQVFSFVYGATGFLDPNQKNIGPKLADLTAPKAAFGAVIPYVKGTIRVAGCVIYMSPKNPVAKTATTGGKGGPGVDNTSFTYNCDILIEVACNELAALRKVYSNGKLVWSRADTSDASSLIVSQTVDNWADIRFYDGNAAQLPDPDYEAAITTLRGAGLAPAYRLRTTIFIKALNLGSSGQMPVLNFEVSSIAANTATVTKFADVPQVSPFTIGSPAFSPNGFYVHVGQWDNAYANSQVFVYYVDSAGTATFDSTYTAPGNAPVAHGLTDVSGLMTSFGDILYSGDTRAVYWSEGNYGSGVTSYRFELPVGESFGSADIRYVMQGDRVILGSDQFGSKNLYRFSKSAAFGLLGTPPVATTPTPLPAFVSSIAISADGLTCYALQYYGNNIYVLDTATLTLLSTLVAPGASGTSNKALLVDEAGVLYFMSDSSATAPYGNAISSWDGSSWNVEYPNVYCGFTQSSAQIGIASGIVFEMSSDNFPGESFSGVQRIHAYLKTVSQSEIGLDTLVSDLATRTGQIDPSTQMDLTQLASSSVRGIAITSLSTTRNTLETLQGAFFFEGVEVGSKIVCVARGAAPVRTLAFSDLGLSRDGTAEAFPRRLLNDVEYPRQINVNYANALNDDQTDTQAGDRLVTTSTSNQAIQLPMVFTPPEAKKIADVTTSDLQNSLMTIGPISVPTKHIDLDPGDVIILTDREGDQFRTRITQADVTDFVPTWTLVIDNAGVIASYVATTSVSSTKTIVGVGVPRLIELDVPLLRDQDDSPGIYVATTSSSSSSSFPGATVMDSDDGASYTNEGATASSCIIGHCTTVLGDWTGARVFDTKNQVTVSVGPGVTLASATTQTLLDDATLNAYAIGVDGRWEIGQFQNATFISDGLYTLSRFIRGSLGTEKKAIGHQVYDKFVLLDSNGIVRTTESATEVGVPRYYKAQSVGSTRTSPVDVFTDTGVSLKPLSTFDPRSTLDGAGNINLSWQRRTRYGTRLIGQLGINIPLGEQSESYSIDVYDASFTAILRTLTATTPSVVYTAAYQTADFGSAQAKVNFIAYQLSGVVTRGTGVPAGLAPSPSYSPSAAPSGGGGGGGGGGSGTVTSVGLTMPAVFAVTGSPVTTAGAITVALADQSKNLIFAGPAAGASAAPSLRAMVGADIPALSINAPTSDYTLVLADGQNTWIVMANATADAVVTIPLHSTVAFPVGCVIPLQRATAYAVTIAGASGVTVNSATGNFGVASVFSTVGLIQTSVDNWLFFGATN